MAQNSHSGIIHLGHANGTMTLWSPNQTTPHVKLLAHRGPIVGIAVDPSEKSAGRFTATAGLDGQVKIWDGRMWGKELRTLNMRNNPLSMAYSGRGLLAVGGKSGVTVFGHDSKPYLTLPLPGLSADHMKFCPFDDILAVGHSRGVSSLLVPGSGEANFDSNEADVFESHTRRREREVRGVLEKIRPELITMDTEYLGNVREELPQSYAEKAGRSYRQKGRMERLREGGADPEGGLDGEEEEESGDENDEGGGGKGEKKKKKKMRGKGKSMARYLEKKKKNVVDNTTVRPFLFAANFLLLLLNAWISLIWVDRSAAEDRRSG